jgi:hypothetical protein
MLHLPSAIEHFLTMSQCFSAAGKEHATQPMFPWDILSPTVWHAIGDHPVWGQHREPRTQRLKHPSHLADSA